MRTVLTRTGRSSRIGFLLVATAAMAVGLNAYLIDGLAGLVWGALLPEDTVYAPGYTDAGFRRVHLGMSYDEVLGQLGEPQRTWPLDGSSDGAEGGARWSYSPSDTNFRCRVLLFRDRRVVDKHAEFYVD